MEVRSYDSMEAMFADMDAAEQAANERLLPQQRELRDDLDHERYWFRPYVEAQVVIFGHAWSFKTACESSAKYVPALGTADAESYEESLAEAVDEIRSVVERRARGYLFGKAWSIIEPSGELGDTHVADAYPISEEAFREAERCGWRIVVADPVVAAMVDPAELALRTTPTLLAEIRALQERPH